MSQMPKWHAARDNCQNGIQKKLIWVLDSADTKCRMIASRSKMPSDLNRNKVQIGS